MPVIVENATHVAIRPVLQSCLLSYTGFGVPRIGAALRYTLTARLETFSFIKRQLFETGYTPKRIAEDAQVLSGRCNKDRHLE